MSPAPDVRGIALIGLALRLPGARTPDEFWTNVRSGVESIRFFTDDELIAAGVSREALAQPHYVKASPVIDGFDEFDAGFFGYSPREAAIMDPQNRLFLETCWQALEDAGYDPERVDDAVVGVFAGAGSALTSYLVHFCGHPDMRGQTAGLGHINADRDFLSTRVSFKLNLTGPSLTVQTACSTSLVAVHLACQALLNGECDMALAGASTVRVPHLEGYLADPGSVHSADGHCRAFDASGRGTIFGSGVAAVVLKDLERAIADRDHVYAVIRGSAVNNDGAGKISYTATSATGQARAMLEALEVAEISADSVSYVECHATGTAAGDPIEIQALTRAFRAHSKRRGFCAIGSVKTNIGHPEQSAGMAGLIKTALALRHAELPPSLHFDTPNPAIPFDSTPFVVQRQLAPWPAGDSPRRAAVNSLGIGGTNAFLVLQEAPPVAPPPSSEPAPHLFCLSARSASALRRRVEQFAAMLKDRTPPALEDLCYTVNVSRSSLRFRFAAVASTHGELQDQLEQFLSASSPSEPIGQAAPIAWLFSGQGAQYPGMSRELYDAVPAFRSAFDECDALLQTHLGRSVREVVFESPENSEDLTQTGIAQPALFAVEYALAQVWRSWGITPAAVMGHSVGELVAACVAGVFDLPQAIALLAARAALMQSVVERGAMAACFVDEATLQRHLRDTGGRVGIAAINGPRQIVVSGAAADVERLTARLHAEEFLTKPLTVSHAFHSELLDPVIAGIASAASRHPARAPTIPLVSNLTGQRLTEPPAPTYWRDQARQPVRFADGLETLAALGCSLFLEVGPGTAALAAVRDCLGPRATLALPSIGRNRSDLQTMKASLRELYLAGSTIDWKRVHDAERRRRIPLPTYPFERTRCWLEPASTSEGRAPDRPRIENNATEAEQTFYSVAWRNVESGLASDSVDPGSWLIYADDSGVGSAVARLVRRRGGSATLVRRPTPGRTGRSVSARTILCLTALDAPLLASVEPSQLANVERTVAAELLGAVRSLNTDVAAADSRVWCVTRRAQCVSSPEMTDPIQALVWGIGRTAALELPGRWGGLVDLGSAGASCEDDANAIVDAILGSNGENEIALRDGRRYVARLERRQRERPGTTLRVRPDRTYLVTGGLGMLGLTVARWLADRGARHLVLVSRHADASRRGASIAELEERGAAVRVITADVSKPTEVRRLLQVIDRELPPLAGVVHSAGVLADGILERMEWRAFTRATAAKVHGAWLLHHHTRRHDLDFFLLQSSLLGLLGSAGQANYTAANAFLDSLVDHRRALGLPATAINWGPWAESGMAASAGARGDSIWRQRGISLISTETGRAVLDFLTSHSIDHVGVTTCNWQHYTRSLHVRSPLLDALAPQVAGGATADLRQQLRGAPAGRRRALLIDALGRQLARELGFDQRLDPRQPLQQLGVDSLMSVNLANRLESSLGIRIPVVKLLRSPSLERLADEVLSEIAPDDNPTSVTVPEPPPARAPVSLSRGNGWLVFPRPNPSADIRLFCFNYAGGGAATYRPWAERVAPAVELVAIEPPGRGSRIDEPPIVRLDLWLETLMREMRPYLDRPAAFFGHCLGGLTMFETARRLASEVDLVHLFVSGCRPPHRLNELSLFEEDLLLTLTKDDGFDPLSALHEQPEHVFATIIRQFDIGVTDEFLARAELRNLLLPAVRADFELTWRYRVGQVRPWDIPITCFTGLDDTYVTREYALEWHRYTQREFRIHFRAGTHFLVAEDREFIVSTINRTLDSALPARAPAQAAP